MHSGAFSMNEKLGGENMHPDDNNIYAPNILDKYAHRPDKPNEMKDMCLADFATMYVHHKAYEGKAPVGFPHKAIGCVQSRLVACANWCALPEAAYSRRVTTIWYCPNGSRRGAAGIDSAHSRISRRCTRHNYKSADGKCIGGSPAALSAFRPLQWVLQPPTGASSGTE